MKMSRRTLLASSAAPLLFGAESASANQAEQTGGYASSDIFDSSSDLMRFSSDSSGLSPLAYTKILQDYIATNDAVEDSYGSGGAIAQLEIEFAKRTGKEKAIYLPTGTMANQLAVKLLSGEKPKVMVQDISHYYRDEAHAAQRLHGRRLVPVKTGAAQYTVEELEHAIKEDQKGEVFPLKVGAISLENPVRRADGEVFDVDEIRKISAFAKKNKIGMHLDGARLYWASAYSGVPVKEYAKLFDTVYISLYKYLGASSGAVLCGPASIIDQVPMLMKIHGGMMADSWTNAVVALDQLKIVEEQLAQAKKRFADFAKAVNTSTVLRVERKENASNVHLLHLNGVDPKAFQNELKEQNIEVGADEQELGAVIPINANARILARDSGRLVEAFKIASETANR
ncbi:MAG: aminotransferase class I/II-fold pyridoxal phosphate-dependent enzyme [Pseudomonadota bacterium]